MITPVRGTNTPTSFSVTAHKAPTHIQTKSTLTSMDDCECVWMSKGCHRIFSYLRNLWNSLFRSSGTLFSAALPLLIDPAMYPHQIKNANKLFVYQQLVEGCSFSEIAVNKYSIQDPEALESLSLFGATHPHIEKITGSFRYDVSTAEAIHWTANFADSFLFGFCEGPLLAQDELQVLEHPALAHLKHGLPEELRVLQLYDAALFQNVPRFGALNTSKSLPNGHSLYGNYFTHASHEEILSRLTKFPAPTKSNIFAIAAPRIPPSLCGQPYQRKDLSALLLTSYNAFRGIKELCPGQRIVIHTGNWGAGAFGNDPKTVHLLQLAAARWAGIDEIRMYPLSHESAFQEARELLEQIENQFPQMTIGQFLDHLSFYADFYGLRYGEGNGT